MYNEVGGANKTVRTINGQSNSEVDRRRIVVSTNVFASANEMIGMDKLETLVKVSKNITLCSLNRVLSHTPD